MSDIYWLDKIAISQDGCAFGERRTTIPDTTFGAEGWTPDRLGSLAGKTYVITGGNAGAGFQASRILLSKGARVVMLNRSGEKSTAAITELRKNLGKERM